MITFFKWLRFKLTGKPYINLGPVEGIGPFQVEMLNLHDECQKKLRQD